VGPRAVLSRAVAGTHRARVLAALPGSPKAVVLAVDRVLGPILAHAVALARGEVARH
jgi:molybdenum cofactor biosynthesis protein B